MPLLSSIASASVRGFSGYGLSSGATFISATGGTITTSGNYKIHTFTSSGTFTVSSAPSGKFLDFLVVGGGGGAASQVGGGAGGVVYKTSQSPSNGSYSVTIGSGGAFGTVNGTSGGNSSFFGFTALGGGAGNSYGVGFSGGSGGAGSSGGSALQPTSASGGFGNAGGTGGGGGAGGAGGANAGGDPYTDPITGDPYAGGGPLSTDGSYLGPGSSTGEGGGYEDDTGTGYAGSGGRVIIRYLFQ